MVHQIHPNSIQLLVHLGGAFKNHLGVKRLSSYQIRVPKQNISPPWRGKQLPETLIRIKAALFHKLGHKSNKITDVEGENTLPHCVVNCTVSLLPLSSILTSAVQLMCDVKRFSKVPSCGERARDCSVCARWIGRLLRLGYLK